MAVDTVARGMAASLEANALKYKGTKQTWAELEALTGQKVGDVWNVNEAHGGYPAGTNYAWNGTEWDALGGNISGIKDNYFCHFNGTTGAFTETQAEIVNALTSGREVILINENYFHFYVALLASDSVKFACLRTSVHQLIEYVFDLDTTNNTITYETTNEVDIPEAFQFTTMPSASTFTGTFPVQYIGTTTSTYTYGYFYRVVSGAWVQTNVQESVAIDNSTITTNASSQLQTVGVIDQKTSNADKFWTGTTAEYEALSSKDSNTLYVITDDYTEPLVNTATGSYSLTVEGTATARNGATNVGVGSIVDGYRASAYGNNASATAQEANAIGFNASATAQGATQIGAGTNATANTLQFQNTTVIDANGKVPSGTLPISTTSVLGGVKPDGTTIEVDANGVISMYGTITSLSGTAITLVEDTVNSLSISENTTFTLPTITDGKFHQIMIFASVTGTPTITWGTSYFFNAEAPTIDGDTYNFIFEYDGTNWYAGALKKGLVS